jgi:hypothetical protein
MFVEVCDDVWKRHWGDSSTWGKMFCEVHGRHQGGSEYANNLLAKTFEIDRENPLEKKNLTVNIRDYSEKTTPISTSWRCH